MKRSQDKHAACVTREEDSSQPGNPMALSEVQRINYSKKPRSITNLFLKGVRVILTTCALLLIAINGHGFDLDEAPDTTIQLTPKLSLGLQVELEAEWQNNFDLDKNVPDDLEIIEPTLSLAAFYQVNQVISFFSNLEAIKTFVSDETGEEEDESALELTELYLTLSNLAGSMDIKIGRQKFKDERQWLYDEELDGIRILYPFANMAVEAWIAEINDRDLLHGDDEDHITFSELRGSYSPLDDNLLSAYVFVRDDHTDENESPVLYGIQLVREIEYDKIEVEYWLNTAVAQGKSGSNRIRGGGFDLGFTNAWNVPYQPSITLGYAFGSGDDDRNDRVDKDFRQTGLQDNSAKFGGVNKLEFYGQVLDPELSNLQIFIAGIGIRPTDKPLPKTSVELVYFYYLQDVASDELRDAAINQDPNGESKDIGSEIDLICGFRSLDKRIKGSLILGYFIPGDAFDDAGDDASFAGIEFQYSF